MPEGDTITKLARRIAQRFVDEALVSSTTRDPRLAGPNATSIGAGSTLMDAAAVGKYLLLRFDGGRTLYSHLGMDGEWAIDRKRPRNPAERQVELTFSDGTLIGSALAKVGLIATGDEGTVIGALGPDLCAVDPPDPGVVADRLRSPPTATLAAAMLDQSRVAGWGNVFAVEVPFIVGLDPARNTDETDNLDDLAAIGIVLIRWSAAGHPRNTTGRRLDHANHFVYASSSGRCPVCGTSITFASAETTPWARASWTCPSCQAAHHDAADLGRARRLLALHPALRMLSN